MKRLLTIILSLVMVLGLAGCEQKNTDTNDQTIGNGEEQSLEVSNNESKFWIDNYEFSDEVKEYSLKINGIEGEITLDKILQLYDVDERWPIDEEYMGFNDSVWFVDDNDNSFAIETKNFSDETLTIKECVENGWWNMGVPVESFEIELSEEEQEVFDEDYYETPLLEKILEKMGRPSAVYVDYSDVNETESRSAFIEYNYGDFTITIMTLEFSEYESLDISSVFYYTSEYIKENGCYYTKYENILE